MHDAVHAEPASPDRTLIDALRRHLQTGVAEPIVLVETHISWVLLCPTVAYKLKKPLRLSFVDFGTLDRRRQACEEELRLNRRLAPSIYLGVVPIFGTAQAPRLDGAGAPIEYAVRMRRFADGDLLSERLAADALLPEHLDGLAARLAAFHEQSAPASPVADPAARAMGPVVDVLRQLRAHVDAVRVDALEARFAAMAHDLGETWAARERDGRVREGHGDLHLANAVLIDGEATAFDCIEFSPALRTIDVISDIAFLTMDLKAHRRDDLAFRFLDSYLQCGGDYAGTSVLRFFEGYRALVRALVARLRPTTGTDRYAPSDPDYLACAEHLIAAANGSARLLITHGLSGSGKSTLARRMLTQAGAIRVRSDVERKRLFGLAALDSSRGLDSSIYGHQATRSTMDRLARCARAALQAGFPVIVDAAFLRRAERDAFRTLAAEMGVPFAILSCTASAAQLRLRVAQRSASGRDASEADLGVLERQLQYEEPLSDDELAGAIEVATDRPVDVAALCDRWSAGR